MALNFSSYSGEAKTGGAKIDSAAIQSSAITLGKVASGAVSGSNLTLSYHFAVLTASTNGTYAVNPFVSATAATAGTITGFFLASASGNAGGTFGLWGTTAGTIAVISNSNTFGAVVGTGVLNAQVLSTDTVRITGTAAVGTATAFVTFMSVN